MKVRDFSLPQTTLENQFLFRNFQTPIHITRYHRGHFYRHFHDFFEIMVVNKSTGRQEINRTIHRLKRRQIYFLSHFHTHEIFRTDERDLDYFNITFKPEVANLPGGDGSLALLKPFFNPTASQPLELDESGYRCIAELCEMASLEIASAGKNVVGIVINLLNTILAYLGRYTSLVVNDERELIALKIIARINLDYSTDLATTEMARGLGLSAARLAQIFRERTGRTIKDMLVERRLVEAKRLLATTDFPITHIIYDSGFNDMAYFHRAFRKDTGLTPGEYRIKSSPH